MKTILLDASFGIFNLLANPLALFLIVIQIKKKLLILMLFQIQNKKNYIMPKKIIYLKIIVKINQIIVMMIKI